MAGSLVCSESGDTDSKGNFSRGRAREEAEATEDRSEKQVCLNLEKKV